MLFVVTKCEFLRISFFLRTSPPYRPQRPFHAHFEPDFPELFSSAKFEPSKSDRRNREIRSGARRRVLTSQGRGKYDKMRRITAILFTACVVFFAIRVDSASGRPVSTTCGHRVNTVSSAAQTFPAVAVLENGNIVVIWERWVANEGDRPETLERTLTMQLLSSEGEKIGEEFFVHRQKFMGSLSADFARTQYTPSIVTNGKNFLVVWKFPAESVSGMILTASNGVLEAVTAAFDVSDSPVSVLARAASVTSLSDGNYVAVWRGENAIFGQVFDSTGNRLYNPLQIPPEQYYNGHFAFCRIALQRPFCSPLERKNSRNFPSIFLCECDKTA